VIRFSPSETQRIRADPSQLHETLNLYVSPGAYIFEPASSSIPTHSLDSDGQTFLSEKDVRESLYVDRRTGRMGLNGEMSELEVSLASSAELSPSASARVFWSDWERTFLMLTLCRRVIRDSIWPGEGHHLLRYHRCPELGDK